MGDIQKSTKQRTDWILFKSLDIIPPYLVPSSIMSIGEEDVAETTIGVNLGSTPALLKASVKNMQVVNLLPAQSNMTLTFAAQDNPSQLIMNLAGFPSAVERYKNKGMDSNVFEKEEVSFIFFKKQIYHFYLQVIIIVSKYTHNIHLPLPTKCRPAAAVAAVVAVAAAVNPTTFQLRLLLQFFLSPRIKLPHQ